MIGPPAPKTKGVRTSNHDPSWGSKRWLGRTECLTPNDQKRAQGWKAQTIHESEMAIFYGCRE